MEDFFDYLLSEIIHLDFFSFLINWFFHKDLCFILFVCVIIILSTFDLSSTYYDMILFVILL